MASTPMLKGQIAQDITGLGYDMRIDYQSTRLTGDNSINPVMTHYVQPNFPEGKTVNNQSWFLPIIALASVGTLILAVGRSR